MIWDWDGSNCTYYCCYCVYFQPALFSYCHVFFFSSSSSFSSYYFYCCCIYFTVACSWFSKGMESV